jgi:hypothetical protein
MTLKQFSLDYLTRNGMFPDQAQQVMSRAVIADDPLTGRWGDDLKGYPPVVRGVLIMHINSAAIEWIDANVPNAWYRPMFLPQDEREELLAQGARLRDAAGESK